jgi:phosphatidylserine/phosphatidylglycerophosphate/cardiolipin synthase-like enzyme
LLNLFKRELESVEESGMSIHTFFDLVPDGMIALMEFDFYKYESILGELASRLIDAQSEDGSFGWDDYDEKHKTYFKIETTCSCIIALSRIFGPEQENVSKGVEFIKKMQSNEDGKYLADDICIALVEVGEGPKISQALSNWKNKLLEQKYARDLPAFLHTSPLYEGKLHIKQIHDKIVEMLERATKEVLVASLYIDMLYEELINLASRGISIRIIARPARDVKGLRDRIGKNVVELLQIATKGNLRTSEVSHTRMIIVDAREVLVSTVDLTRDQLYDEFNAGIWTQNPKTVEDAVTFFENLWNLSEP